MHQPAEVRVAMGIRQLPSGSFQVRFQIDHIAYAATYPTREMAEQAEPLLRARARMRADGEDDEPIEATPTPRASARAPWPTNVLSSSSAAAETIDAILGDLPDLADTADPQSDELLSTGQAAALLGVSRPTLVNWLEAGRIPFERRGVHRRLHRTDVLAYRGRALKQ